ncbi:hypothetical protein [Gorillibacterium sp. sgz5001074]|uniref:hypothetical protein n=1 Tax=Gorillibacterium sp. sgz5001074 TaxID=3446695 RepID=UPI003F66CF28
MRIPSFERYKGWMSGFGIFIAGGIVGAAVFLSVFQQNMSILHQKVGALTNQNKTLADSLESLNKYKKNQQYIGKVDVIVEVDAKNSAATDVNVLNELKSRVYNDIKKVSGISVSAVKEAPEHFYDHVDKKLYRGVFEKDYVVTVRKLMVIQTDFVLYISYGEYNPAPN